MNLIKMLYLFCYEDLPIEVLTDFLKETVKRPWNLSIPKTEDKEQIARMLLAQHDENKRTRRKFIKEYILIKNKEIKGGFLASFLGKTTGA